MKYLIIFSIIIFSFTSFSKSQKLCSPVHIYNGKYVYHFAIHESCSSLSNCWLQFQAPEDSIELKINNKTIFETGLDNYLANEFLLLPLTVQANDHIEIIGKDLNEHLKYPKELCLKIGPHKELRWNNAYSWFFRTGSNLFSAYFLIIITLLMGFSIWLRKSGLGLSLLIYSFVSTVYLISFSEYPRALLEPVVATGAIHFPLRLLQDLCLVLVFYNFYQKFDTSNFIKKISIVYASVIGVYILMSLVGIKNYLYHERIIIIMAPLVAAPMAIGAWFSTKLVDPTERKILIPTSFTLLAFQVNDLFVFWELIDGYYTVRIYIPIVVGMLLFLYFRRMHKESLQGQILSQKQRIFKEFVHDIKSPISVLKIFLATINETPERKNIIQSALDRIEGMLTYINSPRTDIKQKVSIMTLLNEIIAQKRIEHPDMDIQLSTAGEVYTYADRTKIQRIFSNIITNSYEAYAKGRKTLDITIIQGNDEVVILFTDKGKGISRSICHKILEDGFTTKKDGNGIGLSSAKNYLTSIGGDVRLISKEGKGTTVEIKLNTISGNIPESLFEDSPTDTSENVDYILIDDDKYIRLAWEFYAKNTNKTIRTYASVQKFLSEAQKLRKDCAVYLDVNLNGEKSLQYVDKIYNLGFKNIILSTGEEYLENCLPKNVQALAGKLPPLQ